jgi:hypothetical protein
MPPFGSLVPDYDTDHLTCSLYYCFMCKVLLYRLGRNVYVCEAFNGGAALGYRSNVVVSIGHLSLIVIAHFNP